MSFLSACASGGGDTRRRRQAARRPENPLGVKRARRWRSSSSTAVSATSTRRTRRRSTRRSTPRRSQVHRAPRDPVGKLQPRFNRGNPPDLIDNSGAEQMDMGVLVQEASSPTSRRSSTRPPSTTRPRRSGTRCAPASWRWASSRRHGLDHVLRLHRLRRLVLPEGAGRRWARRTRRPGTRCSRSARRPRRRASRAGRTRASTRTTSTSPSTR